MPTSLSHQGLGPEWTPYCGAAPSPADLAGRWNTDPILLVLFAMGWLAYARYRPRDDTRRGGLLVAAGLVLMIAFLSPLCALSSALFSARVAHHALLVAVAAPLLAFGLQGRGMRVGLAAATGIHALVLWAWHAPGAYAWALTHASAYWLMQGALLGSAFIFWSAVRRAGSLPAAAALGATLVQTGLLGALITFAGAPLYAPHLATTLAFGLTPLEDQQLAGLIMWAPMAGAYLLAAVALAYRGLEPARHPERLA